MNRISIVTACMNRNSSLKQALSSWLEIPEIYEIVIVDWNSSVNVFDDLKENFSLQRIKFIQVSNVFKWVLSLAYNLGIKHASGNVILKLDADIILDREFFTQHTLKKGQFLRGNALAAENDNERFLNGICMFFKNDFEKVNGYNEAIRQYGYDDDDLYNRFQLIGLNSKNIKNSYVYHIPHENRHGNQEEFLPVINLPDKHLSWIKNLSNQYLAKNFYQWNLSFKKTEYKTEDKGNKLLCTPINLDINSPNDNELEICKIAALRTGIRNVLKIPPVLVAEFSDEEIIYLYKFYFPIESDNSTFSYGFIKKFNAIVSSYGERLLDFKNRFFELKKIQDEATSQFEQYQNVVNDVVEKGKTNIVSHITGISERNILPEINKAKSEIKVGFGEIDKITKSVFPEIKAYFEENKKHLNEIDKHINGSECQICLTIVNAQESINTVVNNSTKTISDQIENQSLKINNLVNQQEHQNTLFSQQLSMINNQNKEIILLKQRLLETRQAYTELANKPVNKLFKPKAKNRFKND